MLLSEINLKLIGGLWRGPSDHINLWWLWPSVSDLMFQASTYFIILSIRISSSQSVTVNFTTTVVPYTVVPPPLIRAPLLQLKSDLVRGMVSLEGENLVVFYCLSVSEIWPDNRMAFGRSVLIRGGAIAAEY